MNGIGGSGDFARNSYISIFFTESTIKNGHVSCLVPFVSHVDHTEHDVDIIISENGLADLRGLSPKERAKIIIENCSDDYYKPLLREYYNCAKEETKSHTPISLDKALSWHHRLKESGSMKI